MFLRLIGIATIVFCLVSIFHPGRHAKHYPYISIDNVFSELVKFENISSSNLQLCSYNNLLFNNRHIEISDIFRNNIHATPYTGGEYVPKNCKPLFKVAILIPYRNREEQLKIFLNYAHNFLQKQNIHYRIFVIEQKDTLLFNRAKLFNIGANISMNYYRYPCLILHDVDLIPLASGNIYACSQRPRHMSSSLDSFRFNLPYEELFGGVVSILSEQYKQINGMSNLYEGWGGEDDDLYRRLITYDIAPYRFSPVLSKYTMLKHKKARASENRYELLNSGIKRQKVDGLNSLSNFSFHYSIKEKALYTHIFVT